MSKPTNLFRRGAVYWWRRRLPLSVFENPPISLSLSLLTRELSVAHIRGAAMTVQSERLRMTIQQRIIAGVLTPEQANSNANAEAKAFRMQLMMVDANLVAEPYQLPVSPDRSKWVLQQFWQGAQQGGLREIGAKPPPEWRQLGDPLRWPALRALTSKAPVRSDPLASAEPHAP